MRLSILEKGHGFGTKILFAFIHTFSGHPVLDVIKLVKYRPDFSGRPMSGVTQEAMRGPSAWSIGDRELVAAVVANSYPWVQVRVPWAAATRRPCASYVNASEATFGIATPASLPAASTVISRASDGPLWDCRHKQYLRLQHPLLCDHSTDVPGGWDRPIL